MVKKLWESSTKRKVKWLFAGCLEQLFELMHGLFKNDCHDRYSHEKQWLSLDISLSCSLEKWKVMTLHETTSSSIRWSLRIILLKKNGYARRLSHEYQRLYSVFSHDYSHLWHFSSFYKNCNMQRWRKRMTPRQDDHHFASFVLQDLKLLVKLQVNMTKLNKTRIIHNNSCWLLRETGDSWWRIRVRFVCVSSRDKVNCHQMQS